jgi:diguanylate cyclase (GGDEF)-like protein
MSSLVLRAVFAALLACAAAPAHAARYGLLDVPTGQEPPARADVLGGAHDARFVPFDGHERAMPRGRSEAWIRIEPDAADAAAGRVLAVQRAPIDELTLYVRADGAWRSIASGMRSDAGDAPFNVCCFVLDLPVLRAGEAMYLHVRDRLPSPLSVSLDSRRTLAERDRSETVLVTAVITTMLAMMIVNLLFWAVLRGSSWLHYSLFLLFNVLWLARSDFLLTRVPLVRELDHAALFPWTLLGALAAFFATSFLQRFIDLPKSRPRLSRMLALGSWAVVAIALATFFEDERTTTPMRDAFNIGIAALAALSLLAALLSLRSARRPATFVLVGWGVLLALTANRALAALGVTPLDFTSIYGYQVGAALQAIILTIGLADQAFELKHQRDRAQSGRDQALARLMREQVRRNLGEGLSDLAAHNGSDLEFTAFKRVLASLAKVMPLEGAAVLIEGLSDKRVLVVDPAAVHDRFADLIRRKAATLRAAAASQRQLVLPADAVGEPDAASIAVQPLALPGEAWGVMLLTRPRAQEFSPEDFELARDFAAVALKEIDSVRAQVALKQQASFDALTGALNRGNVENLLDTTFSEAVLARQPFSVLFIDLDHFKRINDQYGHPAGDECLVRVTQRILHALKPGQAIGRYGGEEFIVVLPHVDAPTARTLAERICEIIRSRPITSDRLTIPLTVSIGGASRQPGELTPKFALERADQALYAAKRAGRDRVVWAETAGMPA